MKILVTGNAGFIGKHLIPLLLDAGHEIIGLDKNPVHPQMKRARCITGNILDKKIAAILSATFLLANDKSKHLNNYRLLNQKL